MPDTFLAESRLGDGTTRWLVRFGYDGSDFHGWARQPGARTVEGEILRWVARSSSRAPAAATRLEVASRTDRGVSAAGNALTLSSDLSGPVLLRSLNGISPDLFFWGASEVPPEFRVRRALIRTYRYFEPAHTHDLAHWRAAARLFTGRIDVRSLGRGLAAGAPVWRTVESVRVEPSGELFVVETRAASYVWGMVRKTVGALREVDRGHLAPARLAAALAGRERLTLPLAEPERLVLWDVDHGVPTRYRWDGPNRYQRQRRTAERDRISVRGRVLATLEASGDTPRSDAGPE